MAQSQSRYERLLAADIARYAPGLPLSVAERQINQESGFNPDARSPAGAEGIAQFIPSTAAEYGVSNPYDPAQALAGYARMMGRLLHSYGGDKNALAEALSSYNSGNPTAYRDPGFARGQTYNYVRDILGGSGAPAIAAIAGASGAGRAVPTPGRVPAAAPVGPSPQQIQMGHMLAAAALDANQTVGLPTPVGLGNLLAKAAIGAGR